jgi:S1-C subfamily serine protease
LGVVLKDKTDAKGASHVVVSALTPEYNADFVGLQVGDVILEKDHTPLKSAHRFSVETARLPVGTDIILTIRRNGKNDEIMVKTLLWPNVEPTKEEPLAVAENMLPYDQKDALYGLKTDHMVILSVKEDSQAALKGIKKGDRIVRVQNKAAVDDLDLAYYMKDARNSRTPLRLDLEDLQGESYFVELTPEGEIEHDAD